MITAWMLYAIVVGGLLGTGALALENLLRTHGLPSRWIWVASILLSVAWPLGHWSWENRPRPVAPLLVPDAEAAAHAELPTAVFPLEPVTMEVGPESVLRLLDGPILAAWALASSVLFLFFLFVFLRTHRLRSRWTEGKVGDEVVLLSEEWGPAVVGFLRPEVVLPRWCKDLDDRTLRFILDHELEHVRAGDLRVLILAGTVPVLFPWHLPIWWQLTRLRTAVEGDCDLRVLHRHPGQTRPYIDLLLGMGKRGSLRRPLAAMLSEPYETLERRIRIMTMPMPKRPWVRGGVLAGIAGALAVLACAAPGPTEAKDEGEQSAAMTESTRVDAAREGLAIPTFTPFSVRPTIKNRDQVVAALEREYAALREDPGIGGTAEVWFFINEEPRVQEVRLNRSSGHRARDAAAIEVADVIEFTPALNRDQERAVWVSLPIVFTTSDSQEMGSAERGDAVSVRDPVVTVPPDDAPPVDGETGAVSGIIRDATSGQPMANVQVFVGRTGRGTLSNREGRFQIDHVPVGEREVIAHLIGYGETRTGVSVSPGGVAEVDLHLRATAIALDPLIVRLEGAVGS